MNRTTIVDGFAYQTTAPARERETLPLAHYLGLADDAAAGMTFPVAELTIAAAERAAAER
jgi:hypothetical protein